MKFRFIDNAKGALKLLSVHVAAAWAAAVAFVAADPTMLVTAWAAIPPELREYLPPWVRFVVIASAMLGTIYLARIVKQPITKKGEIKEVAEELKSHPHLNLNDDEAKAAAEKLVALQDAAIAEKKRIVETQL